MAKVPTVEKNITLSGIYYKSVMDIMDCLGDEGYNFYDSQFEAVKDPSGAKFRNNSIFFKIRVEVPGNYRNRAALYIKQSIERKEKSWNWDTNYEVELGGVNKDKLNQISVPVNPTELDTKKINDISKAGLIRIDIKPVNGGGSGGGAEETAINECNQALIASYVFNRTGGKLTEGQDLGHEFLEEYYKKHCHLDVSFKILSDFGLDPSWKNSHIKGANFLYEKYHTHNPQKKYKFFRGSGFDDGEIKSAYTRCKRNMGNGKDGKPSTTRFSSEDKWNPADIWIASENYIKNGVKELDKCTNIDELNHHILSYYTSNDLIGVSLKKIESSVHWDVRNVEDFNRDPIAKVADYKFVEKQGQGGYDLQFYSSDKKSHWPMDLYIYYGPKEYNKFQARNFGSSSKGSWQIELKGSGAAQGKIGGGVVAQLLRDSGENYSGLTNLDNKAMWSRCNENHQSDKTRSDVNHDIEVLLTKYKAKDDRKGKLTCNDIASDLANRGTAYRYSKLLGLMLLDCIATSKDSDGLMRRLYIYASSQSDKSGPHVKME